MPISSNFQIVTPNEVNIFGSASHEVNEGECGVRLNIKRIHMKALDQPSQRCESEASDINTSACVADFIEKQLGCNPNIQGSQYSTRTPCTTKYQLLQLKHFVSTYDPVLTMFVHMYIFM